MVCLHGGTELMTIERALLSAKKGSSQVDFMGAVYTGAATDTSGYPYLSVCWSQNYAWAAYRNVNAYVETLVYNTSTNAFSSNASINAVSTYADWSFSVTPLNNDYVLAGFNRDAAMKIYSASSGSITASASNTSSSVIIFDGPAKYDGANNRIITASDANISGWSAKAINLSTNSSFTSLSVASSSQILSPAADSFPTVMAEFDSTYYLVLSSNNVTGQASLCSYPITVVTQNAGSGTSLFNLSAANADTNRIVATYNGNVVIWSRSGTTISSAGSTSLGSTLRTTNINEVHCAVIVKIATNLLAVVYIDNANNLKIRKITVTSDTSLTLGTAETLKTDVTTNQVTAAYNSTLKTMIIGYSKGVFALGRTWMV